MGIIGDITPDPEHVPAHRPEEPEEEVIERLREDVDDSHDADLVPDADRVVPVDEDLDEDL